MQFGLMIAGVRRQMRIRGEVADGVACGTFAAGPRNRIAVLGRQKCLPPDSWDADADGGMYSSADDRREA